MGGIDREGALAGREGFGGGGGGRRLVDARRQGRGVEVSRGKETGGIGVAAMFGFGFVWLVCCQIVGGGIRGEARVGPGPGRVCRRGIVGGGRFLFEEKSGS